MWMAVLKLRYFDCDNTTGNLSLSKHLFEGFTVSKILKSYFVSTVSLLVFIVLHVYLWTTSKSKDHVHRALLLDVIVC